MPYREGDATRLYEGVVVIDRRDKEKQAKSLLCRFADGKERFVSRKQVPQDFDWPENDVVFDLEVSEWMGQQWDDEPPPVVVKVPDVVVLRDIDGKWGPALQIRTQDGRQVWVAKKGIMPGSPVQEDGDRGEIWVAEWLARSKQLEGERTGGEAADARQQTFDSHDHGVGDDGPRRQAEAPNVGSDARGASPWGDDPDGEIPF